MQEPRYYQVPLWKRGKLHDIAVIDYADALAVAPFNWRRSVNGYAMRRKARKTILLHRELMGLQHGDGLEVDHINRDRLDNRRSNLRVVTRAENMLNMSRWYLPTSSRHRGVYWDKSRRKWVAHAQYQRQHYPLGGYDDEDAAGRAVRAFWEARGVDYPDP